MSRNSRRNHGHSVPHHRPPGNAWLVALGLWLLCLLLWLPWLGNLPLRDWDEAGIAQTALEFARSSDFQQLLPTRWGDPYLNKPPGLHLLMALAIRASGTAETSLRLLPCLLGSLAIPLVFALQRQLGRPGRGEGVASALILMTFLPMARHGRLAMLDGALVSASLLLWWGLLISRHQRGPGWGLSGLGGSAVLLLKPPALLGFLGLGLLLRWIDQRRLTHPGRPLSLRWGGGPSPSPPQGLTCVWLWVGLLPGLLWHGWHGWQRGAQALVMWGSQGFARLGQALAAGAHDHGWTMPALEVLEGGWPWLLLLPLGLRLLWRERRTSAGLWRCGLLTGCLAMVLALKTQLPWYTHILWAPLALVLGPALAALWDSSTAPLHHRPGIVTALRCQGRVLATGLVILAVPLLLAALLQWLGIVARLPLASLTTAGLSCGGAGLLLLSGRGRMGLTLMTVGWWLSLLCLWPSQLWIWELNETWSTPALGLAARQLPTGWPLVAPGINRPSLAWYAQRRLRQAPPLPQLPEQPADRLTGYGLIQAVGTEPPDGCLERARTETGAGTQVFALYSCSLPAPRPPA
ncbi:MAG: phospholipid carrier-dependent glycosyltransferase [Aphanocapsa feldmannii 277cV]|uniref:Phospholipid carrier-dependent glycosyltransferase n=1 Tax=Aphanocapsa feldmannii 277cV TaxID=2507553 RepID=A0A524RNM8_9CHRO|nr:MAG: phospholipid carrier-dependent glycosyltransferase [Aphanocapsa feldmannii 277cV]